MIPILYTDSDRALGVTGLTPDDINDEFIVARDLLRTLSVDLFTWLPSHALVFVPPGTSTTDLLQFQSDCLVLYCTHFCASKIVHAILSIYSKETDGKNAYERLGNTDLTALHEETRKQAGYYREQLLASLKATNAAVSVTQFSISTPSYDPVTG